MPESAFPIQAPWPRPRRVLYVSPLAPFSTTAYRFAAMRRLGMHVELMDLEPFRPKTRVLRSLRYRYPVGPLIRQVNRELLRRVRAFQPDVVWFDKPLHFTPETLDEIRRLGAQSVFYVQDGPFGPRNDGCWRQFYRAFRHADLHCLFREADVPRYREWGLPFLRVLLSFEPSMHFPPPASWSDAQRSRELSYIGHPHEDRPEFLLQLAEQFAIPVSIDGNGWAEVLTREQFARYVKQGHLLGPAYREGIWNSRINLSFVTGRNEEDIAHKSIEIAACAGFLLALRTSGHQACFQEDEEAVFFSSVEECADKARYYLKNTARREQIGRRARLRAVHSGYDNDTQLARILNRLDGTHD